MQKLIIPIAALAIGSIAGPARSQEDGRVPGMSHVDPIQTTESWHVPADIGAAFGGQFRAMLHAGNYENHSVSIDSDQNSESFARLRLRPWLGLYDSKSRKYGAYLQVQFGGLEFGKDQEFSKTKNIAGDETGVTLRRGYLWYKPRKTDQLRAGVLDWQDRFGYRSNFEDPQWAVDSYDSSAAVLASSVWDFQVGGVDYSGLIGDGFHYRVGIYSLGVGDRTLSGSGAATLYAMDIDQDIGPHIVGASFYYLDDRDDYSYGTFGGPNANYDRSHDFWLGLRSSVDLAHLRSRIFLIYNKGQVETPDWKHDGLAFGLSADYTLGKHVLRGQFKWSSGNDNSSSANSGEFRTIAQSERDNFGAQSYWSDVAITSPRGPNDVNNLGVGLQNRGLGLMTLQGSVQTTWTEDIGSHVGFAWLQSSEDNPSNGSSSIGLEAVAELQWRFDKRFGVDAGVAYMFTGDFYKASFASASPSDLYAVYVRMQIEL